VTGDTLVFVFNVQQAIVSRVNTKTGGSVNDPPGAAVGEEYGVAQSAAGSYTYNARSIAFFVSMGALNGQAAAE
jgi:hypothetical protein